MKRSLMRPTAALFPAVLLAASLLGNATAVAKLFFYYCVIQLFSLCSMDSFRNAAAREPGVKRVDRRFSGAWLMMIFGIAVCAVAGYFLNWEQNPMLLIAAAGCIIIEQLFEERMYALSHPSDGVILSVVANVLLLAGLMIDSSSGVLAPMNISGFYTACGTGLGMLISIIASYIIEPMHAFSMIPRNIGFFPKACVQTMLYPIAAYVFLMVLFNMEGGVTLEDTIGSNYACGFAGLILWRLSRTVCRRASDESRPLNLLLVAVCALLIVGGCFMEEMISFGIFLIIALICAMVVYCAPSARLYVAFILLCAAWLYSNPYFEFRWVSIICCVIAVILNLKRAFLKKI